MSRTYFCYGRRSRENQLPFAFDTASGRGYHSAAMEQFYVHVFEPSLNRYVFDFRNHAEYSQDKDETCEMQPDMLEQSLLRFLHKKR
jgi:hypothetical protein